MYSLDTIQDFEYEKIVSKEEYDYTGKVYDITVEDVHAYPVEGLIVHNSGAGSLVNYALGICKVNPLDYNLLFDRFLNPDRGHMPDIDSDFGPTRGSEVFDHLNELYGVDRCCNIVTFGNLQIKALIKDISRVYGISVAEMNNITKLVPEDVHNVDELLEVPEIRAYFSAHPGMVDHCKKLHGLPRNTSQHPAGICVLPFPVTDIIPVTNAKATAQGKIYQLGQFEKEQTETAGAVKLDILKLISIELLYDQIDILHKQYHIDLELDTIPMNDEKAWDIICSCDTLGIFQMETTAKPIIKQIMPRNIEELSAVNAFVRPGASGLDLYCAAKKDKNNRKYYHPIIDKLLDATYGAIVYQEDIMNMVSTLLDVSFGKADIYRRALEKPNKGNNAALVQEFEQLAVEKGMQKGIPQSVCEEIRQAILDNSGYGFNKSHSICYSIISYWQAYIKAHYPELFYCSAFNVESIDKIPDFIAEARKHGIKILPPMINKSKFRSEVIDVENKIIRMGLNCIKGLGSAAVDQIVSIQPFSTINEILEAKTVNANGKQTSISKGAIEPAIDIGAFENIPLIVNKKLMEKYLAELNNPNIFISDADNQTSKIHIEDYESLITANEAGTEIVTERVAVYMNRVQQRLWYHFVNEFKAKKPPKNYFIPSELIKGKYLDNFNEEDLIFEKEKKTKTGEIKSRAGLIVPEDKINLFGFAEKDIYEGILEVTRSKPKGIFKVEKEEINIPVYIYVLLMNLQALSELPYNALELYVMDTERFGISFLEHPLEKIVHLITPFNSAPDGALVTTAGIVSSIVARTSAKGTPYFWAYIQTPRETIRVTIWNRTYLNLIKDDKIGLNYLVKIVGKKGFGGLTADTVERLKIK